MELKQWLSLLLFLVFLALSFIHIYWVSGGKRGLEAALPQTENHASVIAIKNHFLSKLSTLLVALTLGIFGVISLELGHFFNLFGKAAHTFGMLISAAFALRSIGDFKYVGFFKKVKNTAFAQKDSVFYIPLCLMISSSLLFLVI